MGHVCNKFGLTEIYLSSGQHSSNTVKETCFSPTQPDLPTASYGTQSFANPLCSTKNSQNLPFVPPVSHDTLNIKKWKSARDMFKHYGITRPSGWLSDIEDLSLSGDGNASPRGYCRYCHVCSTPTWAPTHCSSCGHRLCKRCACEVSGSTPQGLTNFSHHPKPTIIEDVPRYIAASRPDPESVESFRQGITTRSTSESQSRNRMDTQYHQSSNLHAKYIGRSTNDEGREENTLFTVSPAIGADQHISKEQYQKMQSRSNRPIENNPFLVRDRKRREQDMENNSLHTANRMECDDPICRATHVGHHPFRHSVSCSKHWSKQNKQALNLDDAFDRPPQVEVFEKYDMSVPPDKANIIHRHHSADFHSPRHIVDHLTQAVGHNAYDLLKERNEKNIRHVPFKEPNSYLEPFTTPKSITQIDSFHWTPDTVPPGHPSRSSHGRQQHSPATKPVVDALDCRLPEIVNGKSAYETRDTVQSEDRNDPNLPLHYDLQKLRLTSTPSWLKNPTKEAADTTTPLRHINTKSHEAYEHGHDYLSNTSIDNRKGYTGIRSASSTHRADIQKDSNSARLFGHSNQEMHYTLPGTLQITQRQDLQDRLSPHHQDHIRTRSNYEAKSQGEQHLSSTRAHDSTSTNLKAPGISNTTPNIQIDPPKRENQDAPVSVSKRREVFEHFQDHANVATSTNPVSPGHGGGATRKITSSKQNQQQGATPITEGRLSQSLMER
ncbi:hypothetical protein GGR58DRAFT_111826 [Xylaria digitata]|nr:hypothetical protein GGR58DRAFT_111826 [Xylaria digitata]